MILKRRGFHGQSQDLNLYPIQEDEKKYIGPLIQQKMAEHYQAQQEQQLQHQGQQATHMALNGNYTTDNNLTNNNVLFSQQEVQVAKQQQQQQELRQQQMPQQQTNQQMWSQQQQIQRSQMQQQQQVQQNQNKQQRQQIQQQQQVQQQVQQTASISGARSVSVPPIDPFFVAEIKHHNRQESQRSQQQQVVGNTPSASLNPSLASYNQNGQTIGSPILQRSIEHSPPVDAMTIEQRILQEIPQGIHELDRMTSSSPAVPVHTPGHNASSSLASQAVVSSPTTGISSLDFSVQPQEILSSSQLLSNAHSFASAQQSSPPSLQFAENSLLPAIPTSGSGTGRAKEPKQPKRSVAPGSIPKAPTPKQQSQEATAQQNRIPTQQPIASSPAPSSSPIQKKPLPCSTPAIQPTTSAGPVQQTATPSPSTSPSEQVIRTPEEASNLSITSEGQGFGFPDPFSILNPGGDWLPLESKDTDFGLFSPNPAPEIVTTPLPFDLGFTPQSMQEVKATADWALNHSDDVKNGEQNIDLLLHLYDIRNGPSISAEQEQKNFWAFLNPDAMAHDGADTPQDQSNPVPGLDFAAMYPDTNLQEEEEPAMKPQQAFALNKGPYTSAVDAFTHHINQELGVGWEMHADDNFIPDRPAGVVDAETLRMIQNGEMVSTIWDMGNINDMSCSQDNWGPSFN
jgi:hypothetical protein